MKTIASDPQGLLIYKLLVSSVHHGWIDVADNDLFLGKITSDPATLRDLFAGREVPMVACLGHDEHENMVYDRRLYRLEVIGCYVEIPS